MKKHVAIFLAALFVLSFAASAFAIHAEIPAETQAVVAKGATQISLGGEIRFRGWYYDNLGVVEGDGTAFGTNAVPGLPVDSNSKANYDGRVRLNVDAQVSPNVQGYVQIETGNIQNDSVDTYTWGNSGLANISTKGGHKPSNLNVLQAWIQYKGSGLLGIPAGIKVGHMPLALGERTFFDHTQYGDDAIVFFMDPTKQVHVGLLTVKFNEFLPGDNTDDIDGYVALTTIKINDKNTIGANFTHVNSSHGFDGADDEGFKLSNIGVHANGSVGMFGYKVEGNYQFGTNDANSAIDPDTGLVEDEQDFKGYSLMAGVNFKVNPVNIRISGAYGSGDDDATDDEIKSFQTFVGGIQHYTFVYDYRAVTAAGAVGTGIANTMYANLGVDFDATKDLALSVDGYYLRAAKAEDSKNVGWEVDAKATYKIAKNLSYQVNAGYFHAGSFYEDQFGIDDAKSATVVNNVLTLSF